MGKIDDMRRQREEQFARDERAARARASATPGAAPATVEGAVAPIEAEATLRVAPPSTKRKPVADEEGVCSVCGKVRAVQGGMIASHQKGLGKFCPGSRKPPA